LLAPVRPARLRVAPPTPDIAKPTSAQLTEAMTLVRDTGWLEVLEPLMPYALRRARGLHPGGRKPEMTLKAVLVGFLLLAIMERPLLVRDVHRLLAFGLDAASRKHLGLDPKRVITERMVSRAFSLISATLNSSVYAESNAALFDETNAKTLLGLDDDDDLDPYDHARIIDTLLQTNAERMENFIRQGLRATQPADAEHEGDYHLDGTYIHSWEKAKSTRRRVSYIDANGKVHKRPSRPHEKSDPDATWWSKKNDGPISKKGRLIGTSDSGIGYLVTAVTWSEKDCGPNVRGADLPYLISHLSVKTARTNGVIEGANVIESMINHHEAEDAAAHRPDRVRGDILADREYTRASAWQARMHVLGLTPHFALAHEQRGHTTTLPSGAIIVDGIPYSPGMPASLRQFAAPPAFATRQDRAALAAYVLQRKPYRLRVNGSRRQDDGSLNLYCPASNQAKASISCANKPSSLKGSPTRIQIGTALPIITQQPSPAICSQTTVTIPFDEVPFWQPHIPGSPEHQWSYNRRSIVESAFSRIKDEASQSLRRGTYRVMGKAKVSLAVLFNAMASNIVEVKRWRARQAGLYLVDPYKAKKSRTPRRHTRARIHAASKREQSQAAKAGVELLESLGMVIDLETGEILEPEAPQRE
jgi:hypothetical protein